MYLHGSHNKNYVHVVLATTHSVFFSPFFALLCSLASTTVLFFWYLIIHFEYIMEIVYISPPRFGLFSSYSSLLWLQATFMCLYILGRDISWCFGTQNGSDEKRSEENYFSHSTRTHPTMWGESCENNNKSGDLMMTWALMMWDGVGILSTTWGEKFFRWKFLLFAAKHLNVEANGCEGGKLCIYFYYPTRGKNFFFISQHTWFANSCFLFLSEPTSTTTMRKKSGERESERLVNEPSASGDGILLLFLYRNTHDGCLSCVLVNNL